LGTKRLGSGKESSQRETHFELPGREAKERTEENDWWEEFEPSSVVGCVARKFELGSGELTARERVLGMDWKA
jgi:hypothetical protein